MALRKEGGRKANLKESLEDCVKKYWLDPNRDAAEVNIVSAISEAFVKCYLEARTEKYISRFNLVVVKALFGDRESSGSRSGEASRNGGMFSCEKVSKLLSELSRRLDELISPLYAGYHVFDLRLTTVTRLLVHARNPLLPLEVSLAWDPIFNVPFIPSSSLKGAARAYFEINSVVIDSLSASDLFGSEESEGVVVFTDAYPISCKGNSLLEPDVITPHYSEAGYAIDEVSASPVPIVFLTIAPNVTFRSLVALDWEVRPQTAVKVVEKIKEALSMGLGAKTAVGYGRLNVGYSKSERT
ncbi:MAG: type III-B CRISPR module RAMP protein Cmr6 [Zestosphaera sp.]